MFEQLNTKHSGPGPSTSIAVHAVVILLAVLFAAVTPHVYVVSHRLTFAIVQPVVVRHTVMIHHRSTTGGHSLGTPMLVAAGAQHITVRRENIAPPQLVKVDLPSSLEIPQSASHAVAMAPQAKLTGFGGTAAVGAPGPHGTVAASGFGQGVGTGSGRGTGTVAKAGFEMAKAEIPAPVAIAAPIVVATPPHIISIPKAHLKDGINGTVEVRVRLKADGAVDVLGVVKGLTAEQDADAERIAAQVKFEPATKDGQPVDHVSIVVVEFLFS